MFRTLRGRVHPALIASVACILASGVAYGQTEIVFWHWEAMQFMLDQWNQAIEEFEAENPGVKVTMIQVPYWDYASKTVVGYATGTAPDLMLVSLRNQTPYRLVDQGMLLPLEPFIEQSGFDVDDFFPTVLNSFTINGRLVALPRSNAAHALFYNKEIFDQYGVMTPGDQHRRGAWNFEALLETARRLTLDRDGDGVPDVSGISPLRIDLAENMLNFVMLNGGRLFSEDYARVMVNEPEAVEAIEFMAEINRAGTAPGVGGRDAFVAGRVAIFSDWLDRFAAYGGTEDGEIALSFEWDVAPYPANRTNIQTFEHSPSYGIVSTTRHPELTWKLLEKFVSYETQRAWVARGFEPVRKSLANSPVWLEHPTGIQNLDITYNERVIVSEGFPYYYGVAEALRIIESHFARIMQNNEDPAIVIEELYPVAQAALLEGQGRN